MDALTAYKDATRSIWATGDYDRMMRQEGLYEVGNRIAGYTQIGAGETVLDIACGTGNAAIPAAQTGARVTGVDLAPRMLEVASERATAAGVTIDLQEGDAEALPFSDASFDVVLSTFGCMFAPRHEVVAEEIARVLRPGGRLGLCTWTAEGSIGDFFRTVGAYLPPMPSFVQPPLLWGDPGHVRNLFEGTDIELSFKWESWMIGHDSIESAVDCYTTAFGPVILARQLAESENRAAELDDDMARLCGRHNTLTNGHVEFTADYLVILGEKTGWPESSRAER